MSDSNMKDLLQGAAFGEDKPEEEEESDARSPLERLFPEGPENRERHEIELGAKQWAKLKSLAYNHRGVAHFLIDHFDLNDNNL